MRGVLHHAVTVHAIDDSEVIDLLQRQHVALEVHLVITVLECFEHAHDAVVLEVTDLEAHVHYELRCGILHVNTSECFVGAWVLGLEEGTANHTQRLRGVTATSLDLVYLLHDVGDDLFVVV